MAAKVYAAINVMPPSFKMFVVDHAESLGLKIEQNDSIDPWYRLSGEEMKFDVRETESRTAVVRLYVKRGEIPSSLPAWLGKLLNQYEKYLNKWTTDDLHIDVDVEYFIT